MQKFWIAVAAAAHVRQGQVGGFMQVCHGKAAPLKRIQPGDTVIYYSPTVTIGGTDILRAFTALGSVQTGAPYQVEMHPGFCPFRRAVLWFKAAETPIAPLLGELSFTAGKKNWGYSLRFGLLEICQADAALIARAMGLAITPLNLEKTIHPNVHREEGEKSKRNQALSLPGTDSD